MSNKEKVSGEEVEVVAWRYTSGQRLGGKWHYQERFPKWDDRKVREIGQMDSLMTVGQHQRITEALRGEVSRIESEWKDLYADQMELVQERDQLRAEVELLAAERDACWEEFKMLRRSASAEVERLTKRCADFEQGAKAEADAGDEARAECRKLRSQLAQQQVPGWKPVPVEPTRDMIDAANSARGWAETDSTSRGCYRAMLAASPAPAPAGLAPVTEPYTCIGKGGNYELIGRADCAGTLRHTGRFTDEVIVYRDVESGNLYCRAPGDFMVRMEKLPAAPSAEGGE